MMRARRIPIFITACAIALATLNLHAPLPVLGVDEEAGESLYLIDEEGEAEAAQFLQEEEPEEGEPLSPTEEVTEEGQVLSPMGEEAGEGELLSPAEESPAGEEERELPYLLSEEEIAIRAAWGDYPQGLPDEEWDSEQDDDSLELEAQATGKWVRLSGATALDTMQSVLQADGVFANGRGGTVIVATSGGYWDALAASGLAGVKDAPVVLTDGTSLSPQAQAEIQRLKPERIYVMGGKAAVSDAVAKQLEALCPKVERAGGQTAADTAVKLFSLSKNWGDTAVVATSDGYWDALSIAPYAFAYKAPIFLTASSEDTAKRVLPSAAVTALKSGGFKHVVIVGGAAAVSSATEGQIKGAGITDVKRLSGTTALDTSGAIAKWETAQGMGKEHLTVATSDGYWDALSAAPLCGKQGSVLVLVGKQGDYRAFDAVYGYAEGEVSHGHVLGGKAAIPSRVCARIMGNWALKGVGITMRDTQSCDATIDMGVSGTVPGASYRFAWKRSDGAAGVARDWSSSASTRLNVGAMGGYGYGYTIIAEARDASGSLGSTSVALDVRSSGDSELDGYVRDMIGGTGRGSDALRRAYDRIAFDNYYRYQDEYPQGSWETWSKEYAKDFCRNSSGNCYRFASFMLWVAKALGYDVNIISGQILTTRGSWVAHSWCEVRLDGMVYVVDAEAWFEYHENHPDKNFFMVTYADAPLYYRYL